MTREEKILLDLYMKRDSLRKMMRQVGKSITQMETLVEYQRQQAQVTSAKLDEEPPNED